MGYGEPALILALAVMLLGLLGSVLPGLPGVPLIFASALVYASLTSFAFVGVPVVMLLGLFALLALIADLLGGTYGARRFGASNRGTIGGAIGGLLGGLLGAPLLGVGALFGLLIGTVAGVFAGEYLRRAQRGNVPGTSPDAPAAPSGGRDWRRASRAAFGVLVGYAIGAVAQVVLGLLSVVVFVLALLY